jgi:serine/threonine protein kinase
MTQERWQQVKTILNQVVDLQAEQRAAFLDEACKNDSELRKEVEALLGYEIKAESFLKTPALDEYVDENKEPANLLKIQERRVDINMATELIGKILDEKYRIEEKLGQGGMGAVYKATHLGIERPVAIKIITPQLMANPEFIGRFKIEAKAVGKLKHPNIVNVTDFGFAFIESDKVAYLVMELLQGLSLSDLLKSKKQLQLDFVVDIAEQIALAIDFAHKQGVLHRDLKPDNIWLEPNGRGGYNVKILDFGLAKLRNANTFGLTENLLESISVKTSFPLPNSTEANHFINNNIGNTFSNVDTLSLDTLTKVEKNRIQTQALIEKSSTTNGNIDLRTIPSWLTRIGVIMGTPLYMSPEQCQGGEFTPESDIYSLGVIVYEMLAGQTPFSGDIYELIEKHRLAVPPCIRKIRKDIPKGVEKLLLITLSKIPLERPKDPLLFAKLLRLQARGLEPFLSESKIFFDKNYLKFTAPTVFVSLPILVPYIFSFITFLLTECGVFEKISWIESVNNFIYNPFVAIFSLLVLGQAILATCLAVSEQLISNPNGSIRVNSIATKLLRNTNKIVKAEIASIKLLPSFLLKVFNISPNLKKAKVGRSFNVASVLLSEKLGQKAFEDSAVIKVMQPFIRSIETRQILSWLQILFIGLFYFVVFLPTMSITLKGLNGSISFLTFFGAIGFSIFAYLLFLYHLLFRHTMFSVALSKLYLTSIEAPSQMLQIAPQEKPTNTSNYLFKYYLRSAWFNFNEIKLAIILLILARTFFSSSAFLTHASNFFHLLYGTADIQMVYEPKPEQLLIEAIYMGKIDTVKWLLEKPFFIPTETPEKNPLFVASKTGNVEMVKVLAKARRSVFLNSVVDDKGNTILMHLLEKPSALNREAIIKELLLNGANISVKNKNGKTALDIAKENKISLAIN